MANTYNYLAQCGNCASAVLFKITKGITVKSYFKTSKLCPNCGVSSMEYFEVSQGRIYERILEMAQKIDEAIFRYDSCLIGDKKRFISDIKKTMEEY